MSSRRGRWVGIVAAIGFGIGAIAPAAAQEDAMKPIPAGECQKFATQLQDAVGIPMKAGEDDFSDINDSTDGRSCHITGSGSDKAFANSDEAMAAMAKVFGDWHEDPERADSGPDGADDGYTKGNRLAVLGISWEPGPGVVCSDKEPLSACKIQPQQKLWTAMVDIVEKPAAK
jgi:hypothetical protein